MIDIRGLREYPALVKELLGRRGVEASVVEELAEIDSAFRDAVSARDELRARVNDTSRRVAEAYRNKEPVVAERLKEESRHLGVDLDRITAEAAELEKRRREIWLVIPNVPAEEAPVGAGEADNVVVRYWSSEVGSSDVAPNLEYPDFKRVPHWDIGAELDIIDLERGAKLSGSMFPLYKGLGSRLIRALTSFALDEHSDAFLEIRPPTFVKRETMISTGHLPKFADDAYQMERDDLWAIPTAEVPLTSMARDEILEADQLPLKMTAATPCFRREAGSAGRDTRGLLRLHEFDKVELMVYSTPAQASEMHAEILRRAEGLLRRLGLTYRVLDLCTGDLGASSRRTFDLEVYAPGVDRWLEVSSVSWFGDYQARRANVRYRTEPGGSVEFVHTLNGSALAWARVIAALLETGREADGSVTLPAVLSPYLRGVTRIQRPDSEI
ncbi:MAG: serine--tRNA ligase [Nitrospiraceae bacterium]|nr:serine--tRNA ligase [Nitrospiraceae bacterium]